MPDVQIFSGKKVAAPSTYELPGSAEFILKCVRALFDGSGAAGTYLPTVELLSDSGQVIAKAADQNVSVAAGADADVSWFPRVRRGQAVTALGSQCTLLGSGNGNTTLTITLTKAVPARGVLSVIFNAARVAAPDNTPSAPLTVADSNAVPGWEVNTFSGPVIGLANERTPVGPPFNVIQIGSVARPCTANDLGIGSTITVTC